MHAATGGDEKPSLGRSVTGSTMRSGLLLLFPFAAPLPQDFEWAPNYQPEANLHMARLRRDLLESPGFDKRVPPTSNRSAAGTHFSGSGTDVRMQLRFFKVQSVAATDGAMRLKVWLRLRWADTRLSWNESEYGGISTAYFQGDHIPGAEDNEIWIPDIQPYNAIQGLLHTLEASQLRVNSDGSIFYSRPGVLDVMCKFSGLVAFPFDSLQCPIEFGGWTFSGGQQGIQLLDGGYEFSNQEATSGTSYQEYEIDAVNASLTLFEYDCCPSEPWPIVVYRITLRRASGFYMVVSIIPGILLTCLSFVVFWTPTESADPLGYGISVVIVNVLSNLVLIDILPFCGEMIWIDLFAQTNTFFCVLSLFQSAICISLEGNESDHFMPLWFSYLVALVYSRCCCCANSAMRTLHVSAGRAHAAEAKDHAAEAKEHAAEAEDNSRKEMLLASVSLITESVAGVLYRQLKGGDAAMRRRQRSAVATATEDEKVKRLVFFEKLFFLLDEDASMLIDRNECPKPRSPREPLAPAARERPRCAPGAPLPSSAPAPPRSRAHRRPATASCLRTHAGLRHVDR